MKQRSLVSAGENSPEIEYKTKEAESGGKKVDQFWEI